MTYQGALICHLTQYLYCSVMLQFVKVRIDLGMPRNPGGSLGAIIVEPECHILISTLVPTLPKSLCAATPSLRHGRKRYSQLMPVGVCCETII